MDIHPKFRTLNPENKDTINYMKKLTTDEMGRLSTSDFKNVKKNPLVIVLDNVRSLHNVGSTFRTADAFLVDKIYLGGITGKPPHREIQKTALGAQDSVDWEHNTETTEIVKKLKEEKYKVLAIEQTHDSIALQDFTPKEDEKYALIFGNEVFGVSDEVLELCDAAIEIPQFGTKHSLNVSVSLGISLWEFMKKINF